MADTIAQEPGQSDLTYTQPISTSYTGASTGGGSGSSSGGYQSSTGSGGSDMISGIIGAGVDTGALISEGIFTMKELQAAEKSEKRAAALAERQRKDVLAQNAITNQLNRDTFKLNQSQFNFGRMRWGQEFAITKQQWKISKKSQQAQLRNAGFDNLAAEITNAANRDVNLKNYLLQLYGV